MKKASQDGGVKKQEINLNEFANVRDWYCRIAERPAVQRGYEVPKKVGEIPMP